MSEKNHPNFHAVKFVTDCTNSFYESLRGKADAKFLDSKKIKDVILRACKDLEQLGDDSASDWLRR